MGTFANWEKDVLTAIGAPITNENISFLDQWQNAEGGSATFNPLNTTQPEPGASNYNAVGVKNFVSASQGTQATATTLTNGYYPHIFAALKSGNPFAQISDAIRSELNTWGTGSAWLSGSNTGNPNTGNGAQPLIGPNGIIDTNPNDMFRFQVGNFDLGTWLSKNVALLIGLGLLAVAAALIMSDNNPVTTAVKAATSNG